MEFKLKRFERVINVSRIANIHYFEFTKKYHTYKDSHPFRELIYVDNGAINVEAEGYSGLLSKNDLIIHKANEIHSLSCMEDNAPDVIIIGFECEAECLDILSKKPSVLSSEEQKLLTEIIKEGRNVFLPPYDVPNLKDMKKRKNYLFGADQMIKLKLETLLIELVRGKETDNIYENAVSDLKTNEICNYITENFKENITLDELCFLFNTNKTTLCSQFKTSFGNTVIGYVNSLKIKEAKKLIREGNHNLTQISEILGFSSIHYFSRLFKNYENLSPSDYIKTIKARLDINI